MRRIPVLGVDAALSSGGLPMSVAFDNFYCTRRGRSGDFKKLMRNLVHTSVNFNLMWLHSLIASERLVTGYRTSGAGGS